MFIKKCSFFMCFILLFSCHEKQHSSEKKIDVANDSINIKWMNEIEKHPDSLLLKENFIQHLRDSNEYKKAIEITSRFITTDSLNPRLMHIKAVLLLESGDTSESISCFEKTIQRFPNPIDYSYLGSIYSQQKNKKAIQVADILLTIYKKSHEKEGFFIKGLYYANTHDYITALTFFDQCLDRDFLFMEAYREKAMALAELNKYHEAIQVLIRATTLQNSYVEGYFYLGEYYQKIRERANAIKAYQTALLYDPSYAEAAEALKKLEP